MFKSLKLNQKRLFFARHSFQRFFSIDVSEEDTKVFPSSICHNCEIKMGHKKNGGRINLQVWKWVPHSNTSCKTCEHFCKIQKGGRKSKKSSWRPGRPKANENFTLKDVMNLSPTKPLPEAVRKIVGHVVGIECKQSADSIISLPSNTPATGGVSYSINFIGIYFHFSCNCIFSLLLFLSPSLFLFLSFFHFVSLQFLSSLFSTYFLECFFITRSIVKMKQSFCLCESHFFRAFFTNVRLSKRKLFL